MSPDLPSTSTMRTLSPQRAAASRQWITVSPVATLRRARAQALAAGMQFVYTGNVHEPEGQSTFCPDCHAVLVERDCYELGQWGLEDDRCRACHRTIPGRFAARPGDWGSKRLPIVIGA